MCKCSLVVVEKSRTAPLDLRGQGARHLAKSGSTVEAAWRTAKSVDCSKGALDVTSDDYKRLGRRVKLGTDARCKQKAAIRAHGAVLVRAHRFSKRAAPLV